MWKDIEGYEGLYQVSDDGYVRRVANGRILKNRMGVYYSVSLSKHGEKKSHSVHRLVAEAFLGKPEDPRMEVNHKDGDKFNNHVDNLEWVSQKQNLFHAMDTLNTFPFGKPARKVKCLDPITGEIVAEFHSVAESAKAIGKMSARTGITLVCQGYQQTAYGYKWEYAD